MKKSEKMRRLMVELSKGKKSKKKRKRKKPKSVAAEKAVKIDADINKDGKVDEKDASIMEIIAKNIRKIKS